MDHRRPPEMPIQLLRRLAALRVQRKKSKPGPPRVVLDRLHQRRRHTLTTAAAVDQELGNLCAIRLIRRPRRMELHRTNNPVDTASDQEDGTSMRAAIVSRHQSSARSSVRDARKLTAAPDSTASIRTCARPRISESATGGVSRSIVCVDPVIAGNVQLYRESYSCSSSRLPSMN